MSSKMEQIQGFNYAEQQYEQQMPREYVQEENEDD